MLVNWAVGLSRTKRAAFIDKKVTILRATLGSSRKPNGLLANNFPTRTIPPSMHFLHTSSLLRNNMNLRNHGPGGKVSKETLLALASSITSKILVHIKWPLMRNNRPFSVDDFSAFLSWLMMGNILWIILGTTTFGLTTMYLVYAYDNIKGSVCDSEYDEKSDKRSTDRSTLASLTNKILSLGFGFQFEFEKGFVLPEMIDGKLRFSNLNVYYKNLITDNKENLDDEFVNFSGNINSMDISLSFRKWYEGRGLIEDVEIHGLKGKVLKGTNRTVDVIEEPTFTSSSVTNGGFADEEYTQVSENDDLIGTGNQKQLLFLPSYELSNFKLRDSHIEIYEEENDIPLRISIFNCDLPRLRGSQVLFDFLNSTSISGAINESLFTLYKRQNFNNSKGDGKVVRFTLNGINLGNITASSPKLRLNWIVNGKSEITTDITLPQLGDTESNFAVNTEYNRISQIFSQLLHEMISTPCEDKESNKTSRYDSNLLKGALTAIYQTFTNDEQQVRDYNSNEKSSQYMMINVAIKFRDLKASLPSELPVAASSSVPFISLQNLRSLISYINEILASRDSPITVKSTVIHKINDMNDLNDLYHNKILDEIVSDIYEELLRMVELEEQRIIKERSSLWSHSLSSQLLLLGLGVLA